MRQSIPQVDVGARGRWSISGPGVQSVDEVPFTGIQVRTLLLSSEKRNQPMALWEVWRYGLDTFNDSDYTYVCEPALAE